MLLLLLCISLGHAQIPESSSQHEAFSWPDWPAALRLRGRLKEEFAYRLDDPGAVSKIRTLGWLDLKYTFSESVHLRLEGRAWWDGVFAATDRYAGEVEQDQEAEFSLRQALLAISLGSLDVRLGRQHIVWGEALGTFITDVVNPRDLREFVLPEFTELRIPLWAIQVMYHLAPGLNLTGVWTPDVRFHQIGVQGSEFQFQPPPYRFQHPVRRLPDAQEAFRLTRSEGGLRLSWLLRGWDMAFLYYTGADKAPILYQQRVSQAPGPLLILLQAQHPRLHIVGATLSKSLEPVVLRSEVAFTIGKHYETTDPHDPDGVVRRDTLDYVLGVDVTLFDKIETAVQFSQKILLGSATHLTHGSVEAQVTSSLSIRLHTGFDNDTLQPTLLGVVNLPRGDYRCSLTLAYLLTEAVTITLGADIFAGSTHTLYGQFDANDRVYVDMSWKF